MKQKNHARSDEFLGPRSARDRLLCAAETLVIEQGVANVSTRSIGIAAGLNWALISYHFGGLSPMLDELLTLNVEKIASSRERSLAAALEMRTRAARFRDICAAYTDPLWLTKAAWTTAPAYSVVRNLLEFAEKPARHLAIATINASVGRVAHALNGLLPSLSKDHIVMRLRFLSGAAEMMLPKIDQLGLFPMVDGSRPSREALAKQLHLIAKAVFEA